MDGDPSISSSASADGESIPTQYTCEGDDVSPPLSIEDVPIEAEEMATVVDDPDAPGGTFTHWLLWDVPPETESIPEDVSSVESVPSLDGASQGTNDADVIGYSGPCPPTEDGAHTYRFRLLALGEPLSLDPAADRSEFDDAVGSLPRSEAVLAAEYDR